ncbi:putative sugar kinase [Janibacter sp. HTCC2649]|uniref:sugar kinase n=1 Tax=Janibacter sp. HTCC2649 TaxID=313589 RepID=UPI0000671847|nr:sugar kinase [Janibacter sp. HTCC2649]EAP98372.1 putative sugar kinase [Janibacter sp. HTCC2649]
MTVDVLTIGEALVSFRSPGPLAFGAAITPGLAGAESNVAIGLARLGHSVQWLGRVGDDAFGGEIVRTLRGEGVEVDRVVVDGTAPTGLMLLEQRTADLTRVEYHRAGSAGSRLSPEDLDPIAFEDVRSLHVTGITTAISASAAATVQAAVERASAAGAFVSLDVNHRARLWARGDATATLRPLLPHVSLLIASEDELDLVAPGPEDEAVASLLGGRVEQVAIKRGSDGASLLTSDGRVDAAARAVTAIDTVGAGDAFCAGLISGHLDGLDPVGRLDRAVQLGAWAVSTFGDWQGLPRRHDLVDLATHRPGETIR